MTVSYVKIGVETDIDFWDNIVCPDWVDFSAQPSLRNAFHLASSLNHLMEWHWHSLFPNRSFSGSDKTNFVGAREIECPDLAVVRELSNRTKHFGLDRAPKAISHVGMIAGREGQGGYNTGWLGWGVAGAYGSGVAEPYLAGLDGSVIWLAAPFKKAYQYWEAVISNRRNQEASKLGLGGQEEP